MSNSQRRTTGLMVTASALCLALAGCITVKPPDRPIEINLDIQIRQEVLVRLMEDADRLIRENPEAFPQPAPGAPQ